MNRKPTKTTRGPSADEKRFMAWTKEQPCIVCGRPGPSIVDHAYGSTMKHNKTLIGHWFLLSLCSDCDSVDTQGSRRAFVNAFEPKSTLWLKLIENSPIHPPEEVKNAIEDWGR